MTKTKLRLTRSVATLALVLTSGAASAQSQTSPASEQAPAHPAGPVAPDAGQGQAPAGTQLQEVVVTAQKVVNNVQRVPIAIQAVSGDALLKSGIQNTQDLQRFVPGLYVQATGAGGSSFYIRGVGTFNESPTTDSGLAVSLDQVFFSRAYGPDLSLYDLERVEVLKGPQGTLYGRNATGGTVNIVSRKPILGQTSGDLSFEIGDYGEYKTEGGLTVPLSSTLALRAAFQFNTHDGYDKDGYDDADTKAGRLHLLWKPTSNFSVLLTGDYMNNDSHGPGITPYPDHHFITADPYDGGGSPAARAYVIAQNPGPQVGLSAPIAYPSAGCLPGCLPSGFAPTQPGPWQVDQNGYVNVTVKDIKAAIDWDLGFATLTLVPAYVATDFNDIYYKGPTPVYNRSSVGQTSVEARLASPADRRFSWIGGLFYFKEDQSYVTINASTAPTALVYGDNPNYSTESKAAFAQASYTLIDNLKLTAGIRRTIDDKRSVGAVTDVANYMFGPPSSYTVIPLSTTSSSANTYRVGLDWQATPRNLLYTYVATGFHAGGFNVGQAQTRPLCTPNPATATPASFFGCDTAFIYKPEKLTAYAIGSKNRFFNRTLQVDLEAYYWEYENLQVTHLGVINPSVTGIRTDNAGSATIKGVDAEISWLPTPDDLFTINANYNDSQYGQFTYYNVIFGRSVTISDLTDKSFLNAPKFVTSFAYEHTFRLGDGASLVPSISGKYQTKIIYGYMPAGQTTDVYQDPYVKLDATLTYNFPGQRLSLSAFVRNLTDKATILSSTGDNTPGTNSPWVSLAPPRTYGVNVRARF